MVCLEIPLPKDKESSSCGVSHKSVYSLLRNLKLLREYPGTGGPAEWDV